MQFAVRFRSVREDVKNGILACYGCNCVNMQKRSKWLLVIVVTCKCEIVIKPINSLNDVSQVTPNTVQLVVRSDQVPPNIVQYYNSDSMTNTKI
jgi:hypothetical protein